MSENNDRITVRFNSYEMSLLDEIKKEHYNGNNGKEGRNGTTTNVVKDALAFYHTFLEEKEKGNIIVSINPKKVEEKGIIFVREL